MMSENDIRMCVADVMRDDVIENVESILRMLNHPYEESWRAARGRAFTPEEVRAALDQLMDTGLVTPAAEQGPQHDCCPIPREQAGTRYSWADLWFHLEAAGHEAVERWWKAEGKAKYPLEEDQR
jgi:hypothetical protein